MTYDLMVIGAGSGGVRAARIAAGYGKKVVLFESRDVGGTCVIRGCVPKKLLVYASKFAKSVKAAEAFGWNVSPPQFSWQRLIANKNHEINRLNGIYHKLLDDSGVELVQEHGQIADEHTVVADGKTYHGKRILVATGARPFYPDFAGVNYAISSDEALSLETFPEKITVLGAGYIAVEFACIFNALGAEVNLIYRGDKILRGFDDDIRVQAMQAFEKNGINVMLNTQIQQIVKDSEGKFQVQLNDGNLLTQQHQVLVAAGRVANTDGLGLESVNLQCKPNGQIITNENNQTSVESIFAVGDVCNNHNLTPVAIKEGHYLVDRLFKNSNRHLSYDFIPTTVFSQPEIATCGLTEAQAREQYQQVVVYKSQFRAMKYSMTNIDDKTFMKLIVDKETEKVLGCHIMGVDAGEMMQGFAVAMKQGITKTELDQCVGIHPTSAEELVTMR